MRRDKGPLPTGRPLLYCFKLEHLDHEIGPKGLITPRKVFQIGTKAHGFSLFCPKVIDFYALLTEIDEKTDEKSVKWLKSH
jgi:hypothetical protein